VLTSDSESRDEMQVSVKKSLENQTDPNTEQEISESDNFEVHYNNEDGISSSERIDEVYMDSDKISILGHKRIKIVKQRKEQSQRPPPPLELDGRPAPPETTNDKNSKDILYNPEREKLFKQEQFPISTEHEHVPEETPYNSPFTRLEGLPHMQPDRRSFINLDKSAMSTVNRDAYGLPNYHMNTISPTSTRRDLTQDLKVVSTFSLRRSSISPQETIHTGYDSVTQKKTFYCYLCGKEYRSGTGLKQHLLAHKNEKPFGCNICQRRYRWKGDLNRHMYTHLPNNELPLKCPECNKGFVRKDKMQLHINFAHGGGGGASGGGDVATGGITGDVETKDIKTTNIASVSDEKTYRIDDQPSSLVTFSGSPS